MKTWIALLRRRRQPPAARPERAAPSERVPGCGWFDSSHELSHGLMVTEHASPDALAADLPLSDWIGMQLSGWRPGAGR